MINREQIDFLKRISPSDLMWFENSNYKNKVGLIYNISLIKDANVIEVANMVGKCRMSFKPSELEIISELAIQLSLF